MYEFEGLCLDKMMEHETDVLRTLKNESWESTHQITICNGTDQNRWFASLDTNVHSPRELILMASLEEEEEESRMNRSRIGVFKIFNTDYINRKADVAWDILKDHRGKGLGKKLVRAGASFCFEVLNLHRLDAEILDSNKASQKCAVAAYFVHEGTKRSVVHKKGEYIDSLVYGLLRRDFT